MACYTPLKAFRTRVGTGDYDITFNENHPEIIHPLRLPCGSCIGCKADRARDWAIRCTHEASMYEENSFITLTYDEDNLPFKYEKHGKIIKTKDPTLNHKDFQNFMKRLRKNIDTTDGRKVKYFMCGEYGDAYERPHYHLCLFNYDFPDKEIYGEGKAGDTLYNSEILSNAWQNQGYANVGAVTFQSAAYVAGYIDKKITGKMAENHYAGRKPEYTTSSNGIGKTWFDQYYRDVYPSDQVVCKGKDRSYVFRPPRYYDKLYERMNKTDFDYIKSKREESAHLHESNPNNSPKRLLTRYKCKLLGKKNSTRNSLDTNIEKTYVRDSETIKFLENYTRE